MATYSPHAEPVEEYNLPLQTKPSTPQNPLFPAFFPAPGKHGIVLYRARDRSNWFDRNKLNSDLTV
jgi:hypothetical protein